MHTEVLSVQLREMKLQSRETGLFFPLSGASFLPHLALGSLTSKVFQRSIQAT